MRNKKILVYIGLILIGFLAGYLTNTLVNLTRAEAIPNPYKALPSSKQQLPECFAGKCPQYFSWDVTGDQLAESVVVIPTAMTKGAAKVWVINKGKVVFDSSELMDAWVEESKEVTGFYLLYKTNIDNPISHRDKYIYREDHFMQVR